MNIPDRWNPRLWLRDWLNKPSRAEVQAKKILFEDCDFPLFKFSGKTAQSSPLSASQDTVAAFPLHQEKAKEPRTLFCVFPAMFFCFAKKRLLQLLGKGISQ